MMPPDSTYNSSNYRGGQTNPTQLQRDNSQGYQPERRSPNIPRRQLSNNPANGNGKALPASILAGLNAQNGNGGSEMQQPPRMNGYSSNAANSLNNSR
jgi:hypothetical protein